MGRPAKTISDVQVDTWIKLQCDLGKAPNTVTAYARGITDFIGFCSANDVDPLEARKSIIAAYVSDLHARPPGGGRASRAKRSSPPCSQLSNATLRHRLTIVRLFYDHLVEEGLRSTNPVPRGHRGYLDGGRGRPTRGLIPTHRVLPWIPSVEAWRNILEVARAEPTRNRLMLALSYDCALRREELCALQTSDLDPAHRLVTIRAETTKTKAGRVVPYSAPTDDLLVAYLHERRVLSRSRGPLFLSNSPRNRAMPISKWTWSKVVRALGLRAGEPKLGTHTMRHLCLTDLARLGWDVHKIAAFAGHRRVQSTLLYIHLSARDLSTKFAMTAAGLHEDRLRLLAEADE